MKLIWKLLKENISKVQLGGFFIANLIGLTIVLVAFQFYFDISPVFNKKDTLFKRDYYTIAKKVGFLDAINTNSSGFTSNEIAALKKARFVKDLGAFTPSQFNVSAGINQGGIRFNTDMFFESVPNQFIDVKSEDWQFSPVDNTVPIILPKNYLDLYNFGFAESRSLPKLSENMIGMINLDVMLWGNNEQKQMKGRIAGFSNRINTILVPETFMEWANKNYGNAGSTNPSRLIVEIDNITDPQISEYFKAKGYEVEGDNAAVSRMSSMLKILVSVVASVGSIICALSFIILALSIYLLLEKNMEKLKKLRLIGYSKSTTTRPYELLVISINFIILLLSIICVIIAKAKYSNIVTKIWSDYKPVSILNTILIGVSIFLVLTVVNIVIIRKKVK